MLYDKKEREEFEEGQKTYSFQTLEVEDYHLYGRKQEEELNHFERVEEEVTAFEKMREQVSHFEELMEETHFERMMEGEKHFAG